MYYIDTLKAEDIFALDFCNIDKSTEVFSYSYYNAFILNGHTSHQLVIRRKETDSEKSPKYSLFQFEELDSCNRRFFIDGLCSSRIEPITKQKVERTTVHICMLVVNTHTRCQRLANLLMKYTECNGIAIRSFSIYLYVRSSNNIALSLYRGKGYVTDEVLIGYYENPIENALCLTKCINNI